MEFKFRWTKSGSGDSRSSRGCWSTWYWSLQPWYGIGCLFVSGSQLVLHRIRSGYDVLGLHSAEITKPRISTRRLWIPHGHSWNNSVSRGPVVFIPWFGTDMVRCVSATNSPFHVWLDWNKLDTLPMSMQIYIWIGDEIIRNQFSVPINCAPNFFKIQWCSSGATLNSFWKNRVNAPVKHRWFNYFQKYFKK